MTDDNAHVLRRGQGQDGEDYLEVSHTNGGERQQTILPVRDLPSPPTLRSIGILTGGSRSDFTTEAEAALRSMSPTFDVADRTGWFNETFVWPDNNYTGSDNIPICLGREYLHADRVNDRGSLELWQRGFANLARQNSRVMLAISHAFTGPVAALLNIEAPAIQLVGQAGTFKTSLLSSVAAMWGGRNKSWHGTSNGIEEVAMCHHATHLVLDDFRVDNKHPYRDLRSAAIRLFDGRTKERMGEPSKLFCTPVLSSSNRTMDEYARLAGLACDADQAAVRGRLIDVPLLANRTCLFEELHGRLTPLAFIEELSAIAQENPGRPAIRFVSAMQESLASDREALTRWLRDCRTLYETRAAETFQNPVGYDLTRVHGRFATICAAGALAIKLGIVRWSLQHLLEAIVMCEAAHIELCEQGGWGELEGSPWTDLDRYIEANWRSFIDLRDGLLDPKSEHNHLSCPGYINQGNDGTLELLFPYQRLERICHGRGRVYILRSELRRRDVLLEGEARPSVKRFIYQGGDRDERVNVVALRAEAFGPFVVKCKVSSA